MAKTKQDYLNDAGNAFLAMDELEEMMRKVSAKFQESKPGQFECAVCGRYAKGVGIRIFTDYLAAQEFLNNLYIRYEQIYGDAVAAYKTAR